MTTRTQCLWDAFMVLSVVASLGALGVIATSTFLIKNALEQ